MLVLALPASAVAYDKVPTFEAARAVLEVRCLECHTKEKSKGDLILTTRDDMIRGGEGGVCVEPGSPEDSELLKRVRLAADDEDRMPPRKSGERLSNDEIDALSHWIAAGAPWPEGEVLSPQAKTALPRWDAPPDPQILAIEAFPKEVTLETAADFHRVIVIARFKDASTHDITQLSKMTLADPAPAQLSGTSLSPKMDGTTRLRIDYRGLSTEVPVTVKDAGKPRPVSFQLDVMPVLTAAGCNTGSCHGSARGQDGFHLSLYGFDPTRNFSHAMIRRIRAEVLLDSISQVTATPNKFKGLPLGARAVQIADGNTSNYFLTTFGRATVCSCEVKMEANLSQALHLLNGETTQQRVRQGKIVEDFLKEKKSPSEIIGHLYLTTLSRMPTDMERGKLLAAVAAQKEPQAVKETLEDVFWALLNSKEFIFNH